MSPTIQLHGYYELDRTLPSLGEYRFLLLFLYALLLRIAINIEQKLLYVHFFSPRLKSLEYSFSFCFLWVTTEWHTRSHVRAYNVCIVYGRGSSLIASKNICTAFLNNTIRSIVVYVRENLGASSVHMPSPAPTTIVIRLQRLFFCCRRSSLLNALDIYFSSHMVEVHLRSRSSLSLSISLFLFLSFFCDNHIKLGSTAAMHFIEIRVFFPDSDLRAPLPATGKFYFCFERKIE